MKRLLPECLFEAENLLHHSIIQSITNNSHKYFSVNLLFQNLRLNPIIYRLFEYLKNRNIEAYILYADEGSTALAKRDFPNLVESIFSYNRFEKDLPTLTNKNVVIAVSPQPYDFEQFKKICESFEGKIIMFNGKLEDTAVGIGNVGRERRKDFIFSWEKIFWLQPLSNGAIMKLYGAKWELFALDEDGYRYNNSFENKPDEETILESIQTN
ncbi:DUF1995 family protein [Prochlorococcus sp. MIT 1223]|uniref:DUF1995 family protein n=1 Tax=Prochlorococcus sp. MIT 1223 TaxID=3096217 RepID=UPI002A748837|nr:DUF1995 family protein [Prochlorococcus sp. MIT 1223]